MCVKSGAVVKSFMQDPSNNRAFRVVHATLGRIRVSIPQLRYDSIYADRCCQLASSLDGITNVRINPAASSMIVNYKPGVLASQDVENHIAYCISQLIQLHPPTQQPLELKNSSPEVESTESGKPNLKHHIVEEVDANIGSFFGEKVGEVVGETVGGFLLGVEGAKIGTEIGAFIGECLGEEVGDVIGETTESHSDPKKHPDMAELTEIITSAEREIPHTVQKAVGLGMGIVIGETVGEVVGGMLLGPLGMVIGAEVGGLIGGEVGEEFVEIAEHSREISSDSES
jgi:uncharacterized membrane protein